MTSTSLDRISLLFHIALARKIPYVTQGPARSHGFVIIFSFLDSSPRTLKFLTRLSTITWAFVSIHRSTFLKLGWNDEALHTDSLSR
jgi:hypothetical protein